MRSDADIVSRSELYQRSRELSNFEQTLFLRVANTPVQIRLSDPVLVAPLTDAFAHLQDLPFTHPELEILAWTGGPRPYGESGEMGDSWPDGDRPMEALSIVHHLDGVTFVEHPGPRLQHLDKEGRSGFFWAPNANVLPDWEASAPMRFILDAWLTKRGIFLVHAGAVGTQSGSILLAGASGRGKSTAVAACWDSPLKMLADDLCGVEERDCPHLFSLYGSSKVNLDVAPRVRLDRVGRQICNRIENKLLFFPGTSHSTKFLATSALRGIFLCQFLGANDTRISSASTADALKALLSSATLLVPSDRKEQFHRLTRLVSQVPVYRLETGTDLRQIPETILSWLERGL